MYSAAKYIPAKSAHAKRPKSMAREADVCVVIILLLNFLLPLLILADEKFHFILFIRKYGFYSPFHAHALRTFHKYYIMRLDKSFHEFSRFAGIQKLEYVFFFHATLECPFPDSSRPVTDN